MYKSHLAAGVKLDRNQRGLVLRGVGVQVDHAAGVLAARNLFTVEQGWAARRAAGRLEVGAEVVRAASHLGKARATTRVCARGGVNPTVSIRLRLAWVSS